MKLIVSSTAIEGAASMLSKVICTKNALPILGDILCEVKNRELVMTASDSEVFVRTTIALTEMEGDGRFCVSAERLKDALSGLTEQPVTILATTESTCMFTLKHQSGETYFPIDNADEYPLPAAEKYTETLEGLKGEWLRDAMKRTLWATAADELRPVMNGVCFALNDGCLDIVASDGHVMVKSVYSVIDRVALNRIGSFIMPKKVAKLVGDVADEYSPAALEWNERWASIHLPHADITFRLIEGRYPNYNSIIPDALPLCATAPRAQLLSSLRKVLPFALKSSSGSRLVRMEFDAGSLKLSGDDFDFSMGATDQLTVDYTAQPITIGVSGSRLLTICQKLPGQELLVSMADPTRPMIIEPTDQPDDCDVLMLIMPMLLND